ncbi:hypothetical protein [Streptomyces sp. NPDC094032]|uniref:hypothetical protein n=1 Tax=Streptomyces sp. NPDC094032 TaxID=3155308 RepID=UPI0033234292
MPTPDPAKAAITAAGAIRKINHASLDGRLIAPQISSTVQGLVAAVDRMPQALAQLAAQLRRRQEQGQVRMDDGSESGDAVRAVLAYLDDAAGDLEALSVSLHNAASPLFYMAHADTKEIAV